MPLSAPLVITMVRWKAGSTMIIITQPEAADRTIRPMVSRRRLAGVMGDFWLRCSAGLCLGLIARRAKFRRSRERGETTIRYGRNDYDTNELHGLGRRHG